MLFLFLALVGLVTLDIIFAVWIDEKPLLLLVYRAFRARLDLP